MAMSELASKIVEALNGNEHWPSRVDIPHDQDVVVGPLTFRYGGGPRRDRWYLVETPHPCSNGRGGIEHVFEPDPDRAAWHKCIRPDCGYSILTSNLNLGRKP